VGEATGGGFSDFLLRKNRGVSIEGSAVIESKKVGGRRIHIRGPVTFERSFKKKVEGWEGKQRDQSSTILGGYNIERTERGRSRMTVLDSQKFGGIFEFFLYECRVIEKMGKGDSYPNAFCSEENLTPSEGGKN